MLISEVRVDDAVALDVKAHVDLNINLTVNDGTNIKIGDDRDVDLDTNVFSKLRSGK